MTYSTKEIAEILNVTDRTVRRYLSSYISFENGKFEVSAKMLEVLKEEYSGQDSDTNTTDEIETIEQTFSLGQYAELKHIIIEHPALQERINYLLKDIEYHKNCVLKVQNQMDSMIQVIKAKEMKELQANNIKSFPEK